MDVAHWSAVLADQPVSLMRGWLPTVVQVVAVAILVYAICGRTRRWLLQWSPVALLSGVTVAVSAHWYVLAAGFSDTPSPLSLWIWVGVTGVALTVVLLARRRVAEASMTSSWTRAHACSSSSAENSRSACSSSC